MYFVYLECYLSVVNLCVNMNLREGIGRRMAINHWKDRRRSGSWMVWDEEEMRFDHSFLWWIDDPQFSIKTLVYRPIDTSTHCQINCKCYPSADIPTFGHRWYHGSKEKLCSIGRLVPRHILSQQQGGYDPQNLDTLTCRSYRSLAGFWYIQLDQVIGYIVYCDHR